MMKNILLDVYNREIECELKGERYKVRDNGSVYRFSQPGKRARPYDNNWTFGTINGNGYFVIASVPIHRIVAIAFNGLPTSKELVVDHIDTNKQNNRPENLRWVTRLENVLLNPITARRIAIVCGSVEAFLANPLSFRDRFQEPNIKWMSTVSAEDAELALRRLSDWAKSEKPLSGNSLDNWLFNRTYSNVLEKESIPETDIIIESLTINAIQQNWKLPAEFPCCPEKLTDDPLRNYVLQLLPDRIFCINNTYSSKVLECTILDDNKSIIVLTESVDLENAIKPWALAEVTFKNGKYLHKSLSTFFTKNGADKQYCLRRGMEWLGEDSIDDYC